LARLLPSVCPTSMSGAGAAGGAAVAFALQTLATSAGVTGVRLVVLVALWAVGSSTLCCGHDQYAECERNLDRFDAAPARKMFLYRADPMQLFVFVEEILEPYQGEEDATERRDDEMCSLEELCVMRWIKECNLSDDER
jgi:hypothetical protein